MLIDSNVWTRGAVKALLLAACAALGVKLGVISRDNYATARGLPRRRRVGASA
jgi:hypothetical protein